MFYILPILPVLPILIVYILAAILPAIFLLRFIYRHDTVEKEPPGLLALLRLMGVVSAVCSGFLESLAESLLKLLVSPSSPIYVVLTAFLVVAMIEEGTKFWLMKCCTWRHPAFNYRFDGIVYAVFVSLGFAAFENIQYILHYGLSVALPRALLAVPGHMAFAVYMGVFYGRAKRSESQDDGAGVRRNLCLGYVWAVFLHGFYDTCAMIGSIRATVVFVIFIVVVFFQVYRLLRRESAADAPI